jgi:hypothetical protein
MLWELLDTPLMLTIMTLAYAGQPVAALRRPGSPAERLRSLFAVYVNRMFQRSSIVSRYGRQQTENWLGWLAWQMGQHSQTVFYLEQIQPDWLSQGQRWIPRQCVRLITALVGLLIGGLISGLGAGLAGGFYSGLGAGLFGGLSGGLLGLSIGYSQETMGIEIVRWSWSGVFSELLFPSIRRLDCGAKPSLLLVLSCLEA